MLFIVMKTTIFPGLQVVLKSIFKALAPLMQIGLLGTTNTYN